MRKAGGERLRLYRPRVGTFTDLSRAAAAAGLAVARVGPQRLVDDEAAGLHGRERAGGVALAVLHARHVARLVVDEEPARPLAEVRVRLRVEDERVPADVHERRRAVVGTLLGRADRQEGECLVHDALREGELHGLVLDDPVDETVPELLVDEVLVGQLVADRRLGDVGGHGHVRVFLPLDKSG